MKNSVQTALNTLVDATIGSDSAMSLLAYAEANTEEMGWALQVIADTDSEELIDVAHFALWKCCPVELEDHVHAAKGVYFYVIQSAWNEHEQNCFAALEKWIEGLKETNSSSKKSTSKEKKKVAGALPTEPNPSDIQHLKKCFELK